MASVTEAATRSRVRDLGIGPGVLPTGPLNAITDVAGVRVGHRTLNQGESIRTGLTAILPHGDDPFRQRVPAAVVVGNGFGKLIGLSQVAELGEIETPILLTNTLAAPRAADGVLDWVLSRPGNAAVQSVNPLVGETNDGKLNDIRARVVTAAMAVEAIEAATGGPVAEGAVGAGTGTVTFGFKGGIGTSSRRLPGSLGGASVGVLVQSNYGGVLQVDGLDVGRAWGEHFLPEALAGTQQDADGSVMIVVATDAPLSAGSLRRLAARGLAGLARTGAAMSHGSGDYVIAFSTHPGMRRQPGEPRQAQAESEHEGLSPLFQAVIEATEEAILNSLCMATTTTGYRGLTVEALPLGELRQMAADRAELVRGRGAASPVERPQ